MQKLIRTLVLAAPVALMGCAAEETDEFDDAEDDIDVIESGSFETGPELLVNRSFELTFSGGSGTCATGWTLSCSTDGTDQLTFRTSKAAYRGSYGLKFRGGSPGRFTWQWAEVKPNTTYLATVFTRRAGMQKGDAWLSLAFYPLKRESGTPALSFQRVPVGDSTEWHKVRLFVTSPPTAGSVRMTAYVSWDDTSPEQYFDLASLREVY